MSLRDKYTDEEWSKLEKDSSSRDFSPGWTERIKYQRVVIQSDGDGHEYIIPYELNRRFQKLSEESYMKDDWDDFESVFEKYRCNGDPFSEFEFYIKKE